MRILHLAKYYWPRSGGMERVVQDLAEGATAQGHEVAVLAVESRVGGRVGGRQRSTITRVFSFGALGSQEIAPGYLAAARRRADIIHLHHPHPLADVAYACLAYYITRDGERRAGPTALDDAGIPGVEAQVARYGALSGRDARADWPFLVAFSLFRLASIAQGVYARALQGNASDAHALRFKDTARQLSAIARGMAHSGTATG